MLRSVAKSAQMFSVTVEFLRNAFVQSSIATLATQMGAYLRLMSHPGVLFRDVLDALDRGVVIGDDAAVRLHKRLGLPGNAINPIVKRAYWEGKLRELAIEPTALFHPIRPPRPSAKSITIT